MSPRADRALRRVLAIATWMLAFLELAWLVLWLWSMRRFSDTRVLSTLPVLAYLALGPLAVLAGALMGGRYPRTAGVLLTAGGIATAAVVWLGRVPAYGASEAQWCTSLTMVLLGAAWSASARGTRTA